MTADRDTERIVRSWLELGATRLPDHILDAVVDQLPATPQRRAWWPAWRFAQMPTNLKLAMGAAAVVLVAVIGYNLLPGRSDSGVGGPVPSPTATPLPTASPVALGPTDINRSLPAGRYHQGTPFLAPFAVTLPSGWIPYAPATGEMSLSGPPDQNGQQPFFGAFVIERISLDPCREDPAASATPAGSAKPVGTAADIRAALAAMPGFQVGPVTPVTVDGNPALHFDLTNTIDGATAGCVGGQLIPIWTESGGKPVSTNPGSTELLWVVDRPDGPVILVGEAGEPRQQALDSLDTMISTIDFD